MSLDGCGCLSFNSRERPPKERIQRLWVQGRKVKNLEQCGISDTLLLLRRRQISFGRENSGVDIGVRGKIAEVINGQRAALRGRNQSRLESKSGVVGLDLCNVALQGAVQLHALCA